MRGVVPAFLLVDVVIPHTFARDLRAPWKPARRLTDVLRNRGCERRRPVAEELWLPNRESRSFAARPGFDMRTRSRSSSTDLLRGEDASDWLTE